MTARTSREHWEGMYTSRPATELSWYEPQPEESLALIAGSGVRPDASIIDVGAGAATLVDALLDRGFTKLTVVDLSATALRTARDRLGARAGTVTWLDGDVTRIALAPGTYDVWHDRAVFHFLIEAADRERYVTAAWRALREGGYLILATFAPDGPARCSGLPVRRYDAAALQAELGDRFELVTTHRVTHRTPAGGDQRFVYALFRRRGAPFDTVREGA